MGLRMMELVLPRAQADQLPQLLKDKGTHGIWTSPLDADSSVTRILLSSEQAESISDLLTQRYKASDGFRLVLFAVEATLPAVDKPPEPAPPDAKPERTPERISREELYQDVSDGAKISPVYMATVLLSTLVAAVGLIRDNVAVIIGAMVIAPLLGPNVASALASTLGDSDLASRALRAMAVGIVLALALSMLIGLIVPIDPAISELASRAQVSFADVVIALAAGSAGALAYTRGLPTAVIGVMVAVALLPPLVAAGLLLGSGHLALGLRALILLAINITCVNLAGVGTFLAQKVRPRTWWETKRARRATRRAGISWLGMLVILLVLIFFVSR